MPFTLKTLKILPPTNDRESPSTIYEKSLRVGDCSSPSAKSGASPPANDSESLPVWITAYEKWWVTVYLPWEIPTCDRCWTNHMWTTLNNGEYLKTNDDEFPAMNKCITTYQQLISQFINNGELPPVNNLNHHLRITLNSCQAENGCIQKKNVISHLQRIVNNHLQMKKSYHLRMTVKNCKYCTAYQ